MESLTALIQKHPALVFFAIAGVVVLAYYNSNNASAQTAGGDVQFSGGGERAPSIDPGAAAIEQSRISASTSIFQDLSSVVLGSQQSTDALTAAENRNAAELAAEEASLAVQQTLGLAQDAAQTEAARLSAETSRATTAAQLEAEKAALAAQERMNASNNATSRAQTRANDNTNIVDTVIKVGAEIVKFFF